jgi:hypothetical protein
VADHRRGSDETQRLFPKFEPLTRRRVRVLRLVEMNTAANLQHPESGASFRPASLITNASVFIKSLIALQTSCKWILGMSRIDESAS